MSGLRRKEVLGLKRLTLVAIGFLLGGIVAAALGLSVVAAGAALGAAVFALTAHLLSSARRGP